MVKITSREEFENWLEDKPLDWGQVIAARAALRVLPIALNDVSFPPNGLYALSLFAITTHSWIAHNIATHERPDSGGLNLRFADGAPDSVNAIYNVAFAMSHSINGSAAKTANLAAVAAVHAVADANAAAAAVAAGDAAFAAFAAAAIWQSIEEDAQYLEQNNDKNASEYLTHKPLWFADQIPSEIRSQWLDAKSKLLKIDKNFIHWINWYERRLAGHDSAFQIFNDKDRKEDKAILIKLADADRDFWDRGAEYVNAQLGEWLREARERAQERYDQEQRDKEAAEDFIDETNIPPQEASVTSFTAREDGKIDRAPATQENRLRDVPDARQSYADLRKKVEKLRQEGQRLGNNLQEALDELLNSLPEDFEQALAYNVWRDGTNLREIYELHEIALQSPDYDPDKLENAIARKLKGVLSLFNNFAFDDDGLRQRDERIPPQIEIQNAVQEAELSKSITKAAADDKDISTEIVRTDLKQIVETYQIDTNTTYAQQKLIEINKIIRNFFASLFTVAKKSATNVRDGAEREVGKSAIEFIYKNRNSIREYVQTAFSKYPSLQSFIDWVINIIDSSGDS